MAMDMREAQHAEERVLRRNVAALTTSHGSAGFSGDSQQGNILISFNKRI
jgi:hypothetical protein